MKRSMLLMATAILPASAAFGQTTPDPASNPPPQPQAKPAADTGATAEQEIIVTARKREETLLDVPVAVTAVSGRSLERKGAAQTKDLFGTIPSLYLSQSGQRQTDDQFYLTIRGVGSSPVVEPSVGVFVDGVYMPSLGWTADLLDLERIEILRGPQGALFGRNTEGGALSIITRKPGPASRGKLLVEAASFDSYRASGAVSGPLAPNLFAGLAAFGSTTDGYMRNVTRDEPQDNRDRYGFRLTLRTTPTAAMEWTATADYSRSKGRFDAYGDAVADQEIIVVDPQAPAASRGTFLRSNPLAGDRYTTFGNDENRVSTRNHGFSLTGRLDVGFATLTSITGYRNVRSKDRYDNDAIATATSTNDATTHQRILSEELRLGSNGDGVLSWIGGLYVFNERLEQARLSRFVSGVVARPIVGSRDPFGFVSDNVEIGRKGLALFGQASLDLTSKLEATIGARYSLEKVEQSPDLRVRVQIGPTVVNVTNDLAQSKTFKGFSPAASLSYKLSPGVLVYGSVATGFKGGGFTKEVPNTPLQNAELDNETSLNFEAGLKGEFFGRLLTFSSALFHTKLKKQQLATRIELAPGTGIYIPSTLNVGRGHARGFELEALLRPVAPLRLSGSLSYTKTEFDDYIASPATATLPAYDRSGQAFPEVPKWLASATGEYVIGLDSEATLTPAVSWRYVGRKYVGQGNASIPFIWIDSVGLWDASLTYAKGPVTVTAFARNLTDRYYHVNRFFLQPATSAPGYQAWAKPGAPRQLGLRLGYEW